MDMTPIGRTLSFVAISRVFYLKGRAAFTFFRFGLFKVGLKGFCGQCLIVQTLESSYCQSQELRMHIRNHVRCAERQFNFSDLGNKIYAASFSCTFTTR